MASAIFLSLQARRRGSRTTILHLRFVQKAAQRSDRSQGLSTPYVSKRGRGTAELQKPTQTNGHGLHQRARADPRAAGRATEPRASLPARLVLSNVLRAIKLCN